LDNICFFLYSIDQSTAKLSSTEFLISKIASPRRQRKGILKIIGLAITGDL